MVLLLCIIEEEISYKQKSTVYLVFTDGVVISSSPNYHKSNMASSTGEDTLLQVRDFLRYQPLLATSVN